jgi:hypothetical protein
MLGLSNKSLATLLLGSMIATPALAATPYTGCPAGFHRAESEGGGVATVNQATRKAESEGGGVATVNQATRKAESEGGGVATVNMATRKAESEGGGVATVNQATRKASAEQIAQMPCVPNKR